MSVKDKAKILKMLNLVLTNYLLILDEEQNKVSGTFSYICLAVSKAFEQVYSDDLSDVAGRDYLFSLIKMKIHNSDSVTSLLLDTYPGEYEFESQFIGTVYENKPIRYTLQHIRVYIVKELISEIEQDLFPQLFSFKEFLKSL